MGAEVSHYCQRCPENTGWSPSESCGLIIRVTEILRRCVLFAEAGNAGRNGQLASTWLGQKNHSPMEKVSAKKPLGLIAGPSSEATILYRRQLDEQLFARFTDVGPAPLVTNELHGSAIESALRRNDLTDAQRRAVVASKQCVAGGAEALMLGSSALHVALDAVLKNVRVPVLSMVDAALDAIAASGLKRAALVGTRFAVENRYWQTQAQARRLFLAAPVPDVMSRVGVIIRDEICKGQLREESRIELSHICADFIGTGADVIIVAAPELPLLLRERDSDLPLIHAMHLQVANAIAWSTGNVRPGTSSSP